MKRAAIILLAITGMMSTLTCRAQKAIHFPKLYRESRRISTTADPEKAVAKIELILPSIPESKDKFIKLRFILSLRLADLYVRTGAYAQAENLLLSLTANVRERRP